MKTIRRWPKTFAASLIVGMFVALWVFAAGEQARRVSDVKSDERVILFPVAAHRLEDGRWETTLHGWVFEPEGDSLWRNRLIGELRDALDLDPQVDASTILNQRLGWFLVDNERGKNVVALIGDRDRTYPLGPSGPNGHFSGRVTFGERDRDVELYEVVARDGRLFNGHITLIEPRSRIVISDIDDTIKVSHVSDKQKLLRATFLEPFVAAPGMAEAYQRWSRQGARFIYLSNGPWQLYPPLDTFMRDEGFPLGVFEIRNFRIKDSSVLNLFAAPVAAKLPRVERYFEKYPDSRFVLVGDSGEQDPEIYGEIARKYPDQVQHIHIRKVTDEPADAARYREAFKDVDAGRWSLFSTGAELP